MEGAYNAAAWLLDRHVEAGDGGRTAITCRGEHQTYEDTLRQVWRAQNALRALDVRPGERVVMVVNDEPAFVAWFLAALRSGAVPVPVSTMLTADELGALVADAGAGAVVLSEPYAGHLAAIAKQAGDLRTAVVLGTAGADPVVPTHHWPDLVDTSEAPVASTRADSPAFWLYSSGTTGSPKGVMHRHANLEATATTYARSVLDMRPDDRCLSVAKLFFAYGLGNSLTFPMSVAASAVLEPGRPSPASVASLLTDSWPTLFFATPGFVAALLDADLPPETFASVRLTVTAGEALPAELHRRFTSRFGHPMLDGIGSTEALHIFVSNRAGQERPGTSGTPVPGYEVKLLDDTDREITEPDVPGYLHVKGPSTATGYWCRRDATHAAFRGEWLRTGDVYVRSEDGYFTFLGRNNDMIKTGGIWVSPAEVEGVLVEHPDVLEAAVVGARDAEGLETTVAFVVPRSGHTIDPASIDAHCRSRMAAFKRPRRLVEVDQLPKTPTGKIRRFALRERLAASASAGGGRG
jgi:benzoate-CoA ligase family protein